MSLSSSEDLKGPESKLQLVCHEYQAHLVLPCLELSATESISTPVHLSHVAPLAIQEMQSVAGSGARGPLPTQTPAHPGHAQPCPQPQPTRRVRVHRSENVTSSVGNGFPGGEINCDLT